MTIDLDALEKLADGAATVRRDANGLLDGDDAYRIYHAYFEATPPATIKALIADLKEARALLERTWPYTNTLAVGAFDLHSDIRAFLARNGKGEG